MKKICLFQNKLLILFHGGHSTRFGVTSLPQTAFCAHLILSNPFTQKPFPRLHRSCTVSTCMLLRGKVGGSPQIGPAYPHPDLAFTTWQPPRTWDLALKLDCKDRTVTVKAVRHDHIK
jgi:hypothetical protein